MLRIDHLIYGAGDLDRAAAKFVADFGLASVPGGHHPRFGTANRIVPLGSSYIELLAIDDLSRAEANPLGRRLLDRLPEEGLIGWAVATDDIDGVARRLGLSVSEGIRERPDGSTLRWRSAGLPEAMADEPLPFFLSWEVPQELHPGREIATHATHPDGIAWVQVGGDAERILSWIGDGTLPVRIGEPGPGIQAAGIRSDRGELVIR